MKHPPKGDEVKGKMRRSKGQGTAREKKRGFKVKGRGYKNELLNLL